MRATGTSMRATGMRVKKINAYSINCDELTYEIRKPELNNYTSIYYNNSCALINTME